MARCKSSGNIRSDVPDYDLEHCGTLCSAHCVQPWHRDKQWFWGGANLHCVDCLPVCFKRCAPSWSLQCRSTFSPNASPSPFILYNIYPGQPTPAPLSIFVYTCILWLMMIVLDMWHLKCLLRKLNKWEVLSEVTVVRCNCEMDNI